MPRINLAMRSIALPATMKAAATSHGKTDGQMMTNIPRAMKVNPGTSISRPDRAVPSCRGKFLPWGASAQGPFVPFSAPSLRDSVRAPRLLQ